MCETLDRCVKSENYRSEALCTVRVALLVMYVQDRYNFIISSKIIPYKFSFGMVYKRYSTYRDVRYLLDVCYGLFGCLVTVSLVVVTKQICHCLYHIS